MSTAVNPYTISMDELARLAADQTLPPPEPITPDGVTPPSVPEPTVQPRDEQGRFVAVTDPARQLPPSSEVITDPARLLPAADDEAAPVEEFTATIDVGDGAGVQVFSAPTKDELLEKLIEAQENATRKIRELTAKPVVTPAPVVPVAPNPDEEAALAQELLSEPTKALERFYAKRRAEEKAAEAEAQRQAEQAKAAVDAAAAKFITANPDFYECPKNAQRIAGWLRVNGKPENFDTIQEAYNDLNADGLLLPKPTAVAATPARASGLSVRRSAAPPPPPTVNKVKEAYKMPLNELEALIRSGAQI
jgi:hypothetical protein